MVGDGGRDGRSAGRVLGCRASVARAFRAWRSAGETRCDVSDAYAPRDFQLDAEGEVPGQKLVEVVFWVALRDGLERCLEIGKGLDVVDLCRLDQ